MEQVKQFFIEFAPTIASCVISILIPFLVKHISVKHLIKKINEVEPSTEIKHLEDEVKALRREIMLMRGKSE